MWPQVRLRISCRSVIFFFKQKTAYEMRISDWSSDVCSSDLGKARLGRKISAGGGEQQSRRPRAGFDRRSADPAPVPRFPRHALDVLPRERQFEAVIGRVLEQPLPERGAIEAIFDVVATRRRPRAEIDRIAGRKLAVARPRDKNGKTECRDRVG